MQRSVIVHVVVYTDDGLLVSVDPVGWSWSNTIVADEARVSKIWVDLFLKRLNGHFIKVDVLAIDIDRAGLSLVTRDECEVGYTHVLGVAVGGIGSGYA